MKHFIGRLLPSYIPPAVARQGGLRVHRERIIQTLLIIFCILGFPSAVMAGINAIKAGQYALPVLYAAIYLIFPGMLAGRSLPYSVRAMLIVSVAYMLAVAELFESGQLGEVRMFLIAFVALTAVLFHFRYVVVAVLLGFLTILAAGILSTLVTISFLPSLANLNQGTDWGTSLIVYLMISTVIGGSNSMLISKLEENLAVQARLAQKLEQERVSLDLRVQEKIQETNRRLVQLRTAGDISRAISAINEQDLLLQQVTEMLVERFDLYYAGVFLLDDDRQFAVLRAGTGEAGTKMMAAGHKLAVGGASMIGWSVANRTARIALDAGSEAIRFNNPYLPLTRSEMALPLIAHDEVLGALTIQSEKPSAFDADDIATLEGVAGSLAVALENARLYQETRQNLEEIRTLNRVYLQQAWSDAVETYGGLSCEYETTKMVNQQPGHTIQLPLALRDEVIGEINLDIEQPELSQEDRAFIENIAIQTAVALENARLLEEAGRRAAQEKLLNKISSRLMRSIRIDDILSVAAQELGQLPAVSEVSIHLEPHGPLHETEKAFHPVWTPRANGKEHSY